MSIYFVLWLCSVATGLKTIFMAIGITALVIWTIALIIISCESYEGISDFKKWKPGLVYPLAFVFLAIGVAIPKSAHCYAILGVGATINYLSNNDEVCKIPENTFKAINFYLEGIFDKEEVEKIAPKQKEPELTDNEKTLKKAQKVLDLVNELNE